MQETKINWTQMTWGPVSGCDKIDRECKFCYAFTLAENRRGTSAFPNGFDITMRPWKLDEPGRLKAPSLIFGNSTSDWFHEGILFKCFAMIARSSGDGGGRCNARWHTTQSHSTVRDCGSTMRQETWEPRQLKPRRAKCGETPYYLHA